MRPLGILSPTETPRPRRIRSPGGSPTPPLSGASPDGELPHCRSQQCKTNPPPPQAKPPLRFRDHQPKFRDHPNNQQYRRPPTNKPQTKPHQNHSARGGPKVVVAVDTQAGPKRERPRGSVRRSIHPLGVLKPKPAFAGSSLRSPKAAKLRSGPKSAPKAGLCPRPKPGFETSPCPGRSPISVARPLRSGSPLPGRTSHDRPSQPEGLLFRCSLTRASSEETGLPFR